ncbi:MAG: hydantoinase/oxoprolinase family protein [Woeseia sp.]|jgi:N-methylhydantoinase A/oxoprolinase/acetone carboxylase beta subunit|nr:hydantoinase/oxoprolinase family protein [Woeseia sp.]MBT6211111.1 hydantoinase/oxoprolinase family protein [Woeseia sp.]
MTRFNVGIDTGGTYTDAVIVDLQNRAVIASAKAVTTYGDLSIGVSNAVASVLSDAGDDFVRDDIGLVSVSTTLATNALVQGQGAAVTAVLIGFDDQMVERTRILDAVPDTNIVRISGGHDHTGFEAEPLDVKSLQRIVTELRDKTDAFTVASMYSVRNPSHEHQAQEIIRELTGRPLTVSSDLSDALDGPRRALTATLNARIISRIVALITAVRKSLAAESIDSRLMIVKGDGSLASAELVIERPIETILSGPAASVIGARYLSREKNFLISDIGGTTTDIATAHDGWPDVNHEGSLVGEYRTMVHAIDMQTSGLGGDSEVLTDFRGGLSLSSNRVVPLSLVGQHWPSVKTHLRNVINSGVGFRTACRFLLRPEGYDSNELPTDLNEDEEIFLARVGREPTPWSALIHRKVDEKRAARLLSRGLIQSSGLTPSDAAHVLGKQSQWCTETARLGCEIQGRNSTLVSSRVDSIEEEVNVFAEKVIDTVIQKSTRLLLERLSGEALNEDNPLIAAVISGNGKVKNLNVSLSPTIPLIAVGGPATLYYPEVGRRLGSETIIPKFAEVANAVGAAVGMVKTHSTIEITGKDSGGYWVHIDDDPTLVSSAPAALKLAEEAATKIALEQAHAMGASDTDIAVDINRIDLPDTTNDLGLIAATITVECTGTLQ